MTDDGCKAVLVNNQYFARIVAEAVVVVDELRRLAREIDKIADDLEEKIKIDGV